MATRPRARVAPSRDEERPRSTCAGRTRAYVMCGVQGRRLCRRVGREPEIGEREREIAVASGATFNERPCTRGGVGGVLSFALFPVRSSAQTPSVASCSIDSSEAVRVEARRLGGPNHVLCERTLHERLILTRCRHCIGRLPRAAQMFAGCCCSARVQCLGRHRLQERFSCQGAPHSHLERLLCQSASCDFASISMARKHRHSAQN